MLPGEQLTPVEEYLRSERQAKAAFHALVSNPDFDIAYRWLQRSFPLFGPSFVPGHEGNTHAAAIRDGEKNVMRKIEYYLRLPSPVAIERGEAQERPTHAISDLPQSTL